MEPKLIRVREGFSDKGSPGARSALEDAKGLPLEADGPDVLDGQRLRRAKVQRAGPQVLRLRKQLVRLRSKFDK